MVSEVVCETLVLLVVVSRFKTWVWFVIRITHLLCSTSLFSEVMRVPALWSASVLAVISLCSHRNRDLVFSHFLDSLGRDLPLCLRLASVISLSLPLVREIEEVPALVALDWLWLRLLLCVGCSSPVSTSTLVSLSLSDSAWVFEFITLKPYSRFTCTTIFRNS